MKRLSGVTATTTGIAQSALCESEPHIIEKFPGNVDELRRILKFQRGIFHGGHQGVRCAGASLDMRWPDRQPPRFGGRRRESQRLEPAQLHCRAECSRSAHLSSVNPPDCRGEAIATSTDHLEPTRAASALSELPYHPKVLTSWPQEPRQTLRLRKFRLESTCLETKLL